MMNNKNQVPCPPSTLKKRILKNLYIENVDNKIIRVANISIIAEICSLEFDSFLDILEKKFVIVNEISLKNIVKAFKLLFSFEYFIIFLYCPIFNSLRNEI